MTHAEAFEKAKEEATTYYPDGSSAWDSYAFAVAYIRLGKEMDEENKSQRKVALLP